MGLKAHVIMLLKSMPSLFKSDNALLDITFYAKVSRSMNDQMADTKKPPKRRFKS